ncbi:MFS transporter [Clostridium sp. Cult3]|nr:MFS transporter [Clostridium sp. Cult3]
MLFDPWYNYCIINKLTLLNIILSVYKNKGGKNMIDSVNSNASSNDQDSLYRKLSFGTKIGYSFGGTADAIAYDFVAGFLLFFLTDVAGISPKYAGTVVLLAVLWDAVTDPIIGSWSDNTKCKYGKRRPFILGSAFPLGITMMLLFTVVNFEGVGKNVYYTLLAMAFWTAYTAYNIPFFSLGGCLTLDNNERTELRGIAQFFNFIGVFCASALPTFLIGKFNAQGLSDAQSWKYAVVIIASIAIVCALICWRTTRGKEIIIEEDPKEKDKKQSVIQDVKEIMQIKPYLFILLADLVFYMCYTVWTTSTMYYVQYHLGMGETEASLVYAGVGISGMIIALALAKIAVKFDKRSVFIGCLSIAGVVMIAAKFINITTLRGTVIYACLGNIGAAGYWTLIYTLLYDVTDVDEFKYGKRREGMLMAYFSFFGKLGGALVGQFIGLVLHFANYDPALGLNQTQQALDAIDSLFTLYPGILALICALSIVAYPITSKRYEALIKNLELKRAGKPYTTEGFEELL